MEEVELLSRIPLFTSLKPEHLNEIAGKLTLRNYKRGTTIFHKDDPGSTLYIIKTGQVKIGAPSPEGEEMILAILTDGDFFGELSILDGKPRSASATAMETTDTLILNRNDLLDVITGEPEVGIGMLATLSERLRCADLLLEDAVFLDLPARLAKRLLELVEKHGVETDEGLMIDMRLTQHDLANAIGASRESVNRLLGMFQDEGLISIDKQRIHVLRREGLKGYIC
ncbi:MAG: Crp/Fnr family transcriptional regulator [Dehalococcoidia bacterium]|nr:MAG: Crp/Fnr family transcriptional regulator [Dehalococcoidia bacterium]